MQSSVMPPSALSRSKKTCVRSHQRSSMQVNRSHSVRRCKTMHEFHREGARTSFLLNFLLFTTKPVSTVSWGLPLIQGEDKSSLFLGVSCADGLLSKLARVVLGCPRLPECPDLKPGAAQPLQNHNEMLSSTPVSLTAPTYVCIAAQHDVLGYHAASILCTYACM